MARVKVKELELYNVAGNPASVSNSRRQEPGDQVKSRLKLGTLKQITLTGKDRKRYSQAFGSSSAFFHTSNIGAPARV